MEVIEQELDLKTLQITQEEHSADSNTQSITSEVISLEEILNDAKLEATQDDVSFAEFRELSQLRDTIASTPCGSDTVLVQFPVVANTVDIRENNDIKNPIETKKNYSDLPTSPVDKRTPSPQKLETTELRNKEKANEEKNVSNPAAPASPRRKATPSLMPRTLPRSPQAEEKPPSPRSPKVPLAFAIMAGEVSVELPEPTDIEQKAIEEDDIDSDSDDS